MGGSGANGLRSEIFRVFMMILFQHLAHTQDVSSSYLVPSLLSLQVTGRKEASGTTLSLTVKLYYNLLSHKVIGHSSAINLVA